MKIPKWAIITVIVWVAALYVFLAAFTTAALVKVVEMAATR